MTITAPIRARKTIYRGIEMRSRLEAHWAQRLDLGGFDWKYEPHCFADARGQYLPDFRWVEPRPGGRQKVVYVEIKPYVDQPEPICRRMEIIWSSEPEAVLILVEGHGDRFWMGSVSADGHGSWCAHEGDEWMQEG